MAEAPAPDMKALKEDLDQILDAVSDESLPLDQALDYYEQAVKLGMKATELMEARLSVPTENAEGGNTEAGESSAQGGE